MPITWTAYGAQSDPGPYQLPLGAPIEGGPSSTGDRHVLTIDRDNCILYELYRAFPQASSWEADSGVDWNLNSNALRPPAWTSADAAGLPIFPGLVRYDEIAAGRDRPRAALHRERDPAGVRAAGDALRVVEHRPQPPADGAAAAAERRATTSPASPASRGSSSRR